MIKDGYKKEEAIFPAIFGSILSTKGLELYKPTDVPNIEQFSKSSNSLSNISNTHNMSNAVKYALVGVGGVAIVAVGIFAGYKLGEDDSEQITDTQSQREDTESTVGDETVEIVENEVVEEEKGDETKEEPVDPTAGWTTYSNAEFGFSIKYPSSEFDIDESQINAQLPTIYLTMKDSSTGLENHRIISISNPPNPTTTDKEEDSKYEDIVIEEVNHTFVRHFSAEGSGQGHSYWSVDEILVENAMNFSINDKNGYSAKYPDYCNPISGTHNETGEICESTKYNEYSVNQERLDRAHEILQTVELI